MNSHRYLAACVFAIAPLSATAQPTADVITDPNVVIEVDPVFGTNLPPSGQGEIVAHMENHHARAIDGTLIVLHVGWPAPIVDATAAYHLEPAGAAVVHLPTATASTLFFQAKSASGAYIFQKEITSGSASSAIIADLEPVSPLAGALSRVAINPEYRPLSYYGGYGGTNPTIEVLTPRASRETGDVMLPSYLAGWQGVHLAILGSDDLAKISGVELEALSAFVLAGGTLAVIPRRGGDLRAPTLTAFVGGEVSETAPATVELATVVPIPPQPPNAQKWSGNPVSPQGSTEISGFTGGNLTPSPFGASAPYGLGQVVLLGFDARSNGALEDPWVQVRLAELTRQAFERRAVVAADPGAVPPERTYLPGGEGPYRDVRRLLDPNENARWGIAVGAVLLIAHAILAGPFLFARARRRGRPLAALLLLPVLSIAAFVAVVALGFIAKGTSSRARHLTFIDLGAGMKHGISRRFRGFYSASSRMLDVVPATRTATLALGGSNAEAATPEEGALAVDRSGAYLTGVAVAPWQTLVVREDGVRTVGDGIGITAKAGTADVLVRNGSGHLLRSVVVKLADDQFRFIGRVAPDETVDTSKLSVLPPSFREWVAAVKTVRVFGRMPVHGLNGRKLAEALQGYGDVGAWWQAIGSSTSEAVDWFPSGVPVALAEVDGAGNDRADSGMKLDSDRTLVRVIGYGGGP